MKKVILSSLCFAFLFACNREETPSSNQQALESINAGILTKAYDTTWETGDEIGVFMLAAEEAAEPFSVSNRKYTNDQGGTVFNSASGDNLIFFPPNSSKVTFKGYYPYRENLEKDAIYSVDIHNQTTLSVIDLMTSDASAEFSKFEKDIHITFYHRFVKLIFEFTVEDYLGISLADFNLSLETLPTKGTYNVLEDILTIDPSSATAIAIPVRNDQEYAERTGIVLPRPAGEPILLRLIRQSDRAEFNAEIPATLELLKGHEYRFRLRVEGSPITLRIEDITIYKWEPEDGGELILK